MTDTFDISVGGFPGSPGFTGATGGNIMAIGLFVALSTISVPGGTTLVQTSGHTVAGKGHAIYVENAALDDAAVAAYPLARGKSANGRYFELSSQQAHTPQMFAAVADGATDDSAAFIAALAYLKSFALNTGGSGFYKGSPELFIPAGHYYLNTTPLDVNHGLIIRGEGDGQFGPGGGGCTRLRWAAGTDGIRIQAADTSGNTTVDGTIHDGSASGVLSDMCLEGGFNGTTESDHHGLVLRSAVHAHRLYIKNWPGEAVKCWAGTVSGVGNIHGNVSTTFLERIKTEGCRGGIDIRGADANVITVINCQGYQNRWFGLLDDNGAGANTNIGMHCASNGVVTGTWPQTQCSYSGNRYAAKWGGDPTVAPSGTTADDANWFYIEAGGAVANLIPAWVNTPGTFRAGGDYVTLNTAGVSLIQPYSETGTFSQFNPYTKIDNGTLLSKYYRGGVQELAFAAGGKDILAGRANCYVRLRTDVSEAGISTANADGSGTGFGGISFTRGGGAFIFALTGGINLYQNNSLVGVIDNTGIALPVGEVVKINGTQVVGARQTGTPADATDLATAITLVNALKAKLVTHGMIS